MSKNERFQTRMMDDAVFQDCAMARARFDDVNLSESVFSNISFKGAAFTDVNMTGVSIEDANITGLTIFGHDIQALIKNHEAAAMAAEPQLFVSDIEKSSRFYVDKLGFHIAFSHGDPPYYAQVKRGGWRLNLRLVHGPVYAEDFHKREVDALSVTLTLNDAKSLFAEYQEADIAFHQPLKEESWGALTFIIRDPDGNLIAFAG